MHFHGPPPFPCQRNDLIFALFPIERKKAPPISLSPYRTRSILFLLMTLQSQLWFLVSVDAHLTPCHAAPRGQSSDDQKLPITCHLPQFYPGYYPCTSNFPYRAGSFGPSQVPKPLFVSPSQHTPNSLPGQLPAVPGPSLCYPRPRSTVLCCRLLLRPVRPPTVPESFDSRMRHYSPYLFGCHRHLYKRTSESQPTLTAGPSGPSQVVRVTLAAHSDSPPGPRPDPSLFYLLAP